MRIFLLVVSLLVFNFLDAQNVVEYVKFSGHISNHHGDEVKIFMGNKYLKIQQRLHVT